MDESSEILVGLKTMNEALKFFRGLRDMLPAGPQQDEARQRVEQAEMAIATGEAQIAKALGYKLCRCTFPPQIMLWKESEKAHLCPNPDCGRKIEAQPLRTGVVRSRFVTSRGGY